MAIVGIRNAAELKNALNLPIKRSIDQLSDIILKKMKDNIKTIVYGAGTPSKYKRQGLNGGFLGSWMYIQQWDFGNVLAKSTIFMNPDALRLDQANWIHGSSYNKKDGTHYESDIRKVLDSMIIEAGDLVGNKFGYGWWKEPRDFFSPTLEYVEKDILQSEIKTVFAKNKLILV
jgi:hypothetical protein